MFKVLLLATLATAVFGQDDQTCQSLQQQHDITGSVHDINWGLTTGVMLDCQHCATITNHQMMYKQLQSITVLQGSFDFRASPGIFDSVLVQINNIPRSLPTVITVHVNAGIGLEAPEFIRIYGTAQSLGSSIHMTLKHNDGSLFNHLIPYKVHYTISFKDVHYYNPCVSTSCIGQESNRLVTMGESEWTIRHQIVDVLEQNNVVEYRGDVQATWNSDISISEGIVIVAVVGGINIQSPTGGIFFTGVVIGRDTHPLVFYGLTKPTPLSIQAHFARADGSDMVGTSHVLINFEIHSTDEIATQYPPPQGNSEQTGGAYYNNFRWLSTTGSVVIANPAAYTRQGKYVSITGTTATGVFRQSDVFAISLPTPANVHYSDLADATLSMYSYNQGQKDDGIVHQLTFDFFHVMPSGDVDVGFSSTSNVDFDCTVKVCEFSYAIRYVSIFGT